MRKVICKLENLNEKASFAAYRIYCGIAGRKVFSAAVRTLAAGVALVGLAGTALAWTTPASGSFLYDAYDIAVNKLLKGPVGFLAGMGLIGLGGHAFLEGKKGQGVIAVLSGGCLVKLDSITESLGFYV